MKCLQYRPRVLYKTLRDCAKRWANTVYTYSFFNLVQLGLRTDMPSSTRMNLGWVEIYHARAAYPLRFCIIEKASLKRETTVC